jgi:hypothetical protein
MFIPSAFAFLIQLQINDKGKVSYKLTDLVSSDKMSGEEGGEGENGKQEAAKMTGAVIEARMRLYESKGMWAESIKMQRVLLKKARESEDTKDQIQVLLPTPS